MQGHFSRGKTVLRVTELCVHHGHLVSARGERSKIYKISSRMIGLCTLQTQPIQVPLYYMHALIGKRKAINPPLHSILKDKDYIEAFALAGKKFTIGNNKVKLVGKEMRSAQEKATAEWIREHPELAATLRGADYKSQFEQMRSRVGFKKAADFIKRKARAASLRAHKLKFLWGPYRVSMW